MNQNNLLETIVEFNEKSRPRKKKIWEKKGNTFESVNPLYEGSQLTINAFKSRIFPIKLTQERGLKMLTPKQMLQKLPISLSQVKAGNTSENLLNEIRQIIISFY